ncbi:MAG: 7-carboxy-7-deazaguanine synthase QueE [Actinomycetia bacterium]|nr:7-carboxy-7-deazaguanine synthase QueE [Actinomycetes bacterium]
MGNNLKAHLIEIFPSFQGEGILTGTPQIFIRFAGCLLDCSYCDTDTSFQNNVEIKKVIGEKNTLLVKNPISVNKLLEIVHEIRERNKINWISLTGGEPLLQIVFIKDFLNRLKKEEGLFVYLETNGVLEENIKPIISLIDFISMDFKLPSATKKNGIFKESKKFLSNWKEKKGQVKVVVTKNTKKSEIEKAVKIVSLIDKNIPFVILPVTPVRNICPPCQEELFVFYKIAREHLREVFIMPQIHTIMKWQ